MPGEISFSSRTGLNLEITDPQVLRYLFYQPQWLDEMKNLRNLFGCFTKVKLLMFGTHEELARQLNPKIPGWVIATHLEHTIFMLDYQIWKSSHSGCFNQILTHEWVHVLMYHWNTRVPLWLNEGLAVYCAKQLHDGPGTDIAVFIPRIYQANHHDENFYTNSGFVVQKIIQTYGLDIIARIPEIRVFETDGIFGVENLKVLCSC